VNQDLRLGVAYCERSRHDYDTMIGPETIVVVDDDPRFRDLVRVLLEQAGYRVLALDDGTAVLDAAAAERPAAVVLDVNLPGLNGYEVCQRLREQLDPELGIIFVSGDRTESFDRTAGLLLGADDYLAKPFDPSELLARVRRFSRRHPDGNGNGTPAAPSRLDALTPREREILRLLADGVSPDDIAEQLVISPKTVATHIQHVLAKLGVGSRVQAVSLALHERALRTQ
jgi:two-component system OmpR family response regulator